MLTLVKYLIIPVITLFSGTEEARILAVSPIPLLSHQVVFYPIVSELARRGHEVTFITTNPELKNKNSLENLKEINLQELSYSIWKKEFNISEYDNNAYEETKALLEVMPRVFQEQCDNVKYLMRQEISFDLLLLEAHFRPAMIWSHIHKVPVIKVSSSGMAFDNPENFGAPIHPLHFPSATHQRIYNLTFWETITELYKRYCLEKIYQNNEEVENEIVKKIIGPEVPPLSELQKNADMLFLNVNNLWDRNRPVPKNVVYFGHGHQKPAEEIPQDIKSFLDISEAAIYVNIGTNMSPSRLPPCTLRMFTKVFSELPYRVLWQSDMDELARGSSNVIIKKWLPKSDIFRHPNLKLVITQGDLQTTEEAIQAGVPLLAVPLFKDQLLNVENIVQLGIGLQLDIDNLNEEQFRSHILKLIENPSFRRNTLQLRTYILDTPITALNRAISWIEYVLKHSGTMHLRSPASNMSWFEYYEIELLTIVVTSFLIMIFSIRYFMIYLFRKIETIVAYQTPTNERKDCWIHE